MDIRPLQPQTLRALLRRTARPAVTPTAVDTFAPGTVVPGGHLTLASAAAAAVPAPISSALRVATALQGKGFTLSRRRRFWIPYLMKRDVTLTADEFSQRLDSGDSRLQIASSALAPVAVRNRHDLDAVDAFYLGGRRENLPQAALADSLNALFVKGWHFASKKGEDVGPYGAWQVLTSGGTGLQASKDTSIALGSEEDVHRIRCFEVDGSAAGLAHPVEAQTLLDLAQKKVEIRLRGEFQSSRPETVYRQLFQQNEPVSLWAGSRTLAAVPLDAAALRDGAALLRQYDRVMADANRVAAAFPRYPQEAWNELRTPLATETLDQRIAWLASLDAVSGGNASAVKAFAAVRAHLRAGDRFEDELASFREVRALTPAGHDAAVAVYLALRDHLDQTVPGSEPPAERRALFLSLYGVRHDAAAVTQTWKSLDGDGTRAERVDAYRRLLTVEKESHDNALAAYHSMQARRAPTETIGETVEAYARIRGRVAPYDSAGGRKAFEFLRDGLDAAIPGPFTRPQREALFLSLLDAFHNTDTALQTLDFSRRKPDEELPARIEAFLALRGTENASVDSARTAMSAVVRCRRPGETLADAVRDYQEIRARVSRYDTAQGVKAFEHLRGDLAASMAGPSTVDEKRAMYLHLLDATHSHDSAMAHYARLAGGRPAVDLPQRLEAWTGLCALENGAQESAYKALAAIDGVREAGEPLSDVVAEYARLRAKVPKYDTEDACHLLTFERREMGTALPGPWTDAERRAMHEQLLDPLHTHAAARTWLDRLCGRDSAHPGVAPPLDLPRRVAAFTALLPAEQGTADNAWKALTAITSAPSGTLEENVADYIALRTHVPRYDANEGVALFNALHHDFTAAQRAGFLQVKGAFPSVARAREVYAALSAGGGDVDERIDALATLCKHERLGAEAAYKAFGALQAHRLPGETIGQACAAYQAVRDACLPYDANGPLEAFAFMRDKVEPSRQGLFLQVMGGYGSRGPTAWTTLEQAGGAAHFEARVWMMLGQPREKWDALLAAFGRVAASIPPGIDRDRAGLALVPVAAMSQEKALSHLLTRVAERAASGDGDRLAALEWMAPLMTAAQTPQHFDEALAVLDAPGTGTASERRTVLLDLSRAAGGKGFSASLEVVRAMEKLTAADFTAAAPLTGGLLRAMPADVAGACGALRRLIDGRAAGLYGDVTLDVLVGRFSELYATAGSVDRVMARLEQEAHSGQLHIDRQDDYVVIGGIKVPRQKAG